MRYLAGEIELEPQIIIEVTHLNGLSPKQDSN
jgi:hypothetical protein